MARLHLFDGPHAVPHTYRELLLLRYRAWLSDVEFFCLDPEHQKFLDTKRRVRPWIEGPERLDVLGGVRQWLEAQINPPTIGSIL